MIKPGYELVLIATPLASYLGIPIIVTDMIDEAVSSVLDKKYVALHEFALYAEPAFNPYQPCNEGQ